MFIENGHWAKTQYLLEQGLDVSALRHKVFADNIANVDTPHFKRSEVSFESEIRRVLDQQRIVSENNIPAKLTDEQHIPFWRSREVQSVKPRTHIDYLTSMRNDGNNVDPEHEVSQQTKNMMTYQAITNQINNQFKVMNIVLRNP